MTSTKSLSNAARSRSVAIEEVAVVHPSEVIKKLEAELNREKRRAQRWRMIAIIRREQLMITFDQMYDIIDDLISDEEELEHAALMQGIFRTLRLH
jgi:hypothetical protein